MKRFLPDPELTAVERAEFDSLLESGERCSPEQLSPCGWCERLTDFYPLGKQNSACCRFCWVQRERADGPKWITITAAELTPPVDLEGA